MESNYNDFTHWKNNVDQESFVYYPYSIISLEVEDSSELINFCNSSTFCLLKQNKNVIAKSILFTSWQELLYERMLMMNYIKMTGNIKCVKCIWSGFEIK